MNFLTKTVQHHLKYLLKTNHFNLILSAIWLDFLASKTPLTSVQSLKKTMVRHSIDAHQAYLTHFIEALDFSELKPLEVDRLTSMIKQSIQPLQTKTYTDNPYYQTVKPLPVQIKDWQLTYQTIKPYQGCLFGDVIIDTNTYQETTPIGYFQTAFPFLAIEYKGTTWMSVTPFEIESMKPVLAIVKGHVVALGLGLGYFAFMASLSPFVTHITIIEKDPLAIQIFFAHIFPFFPYQDKITIIEDDALEYLTKPDPSIDHLFVDIYHTADDGLPLYLKIKKLQPLWTRTHFSYWLEQSILGLIRRFMFLYLSHPLSISSKGNNSWSKQWFTALDSLFQATPISSFQQLDAWLSDQQIFNIINQLPLIND